MTPRGVARLPAAAADLQVNCCKDPACTHFAVRPDPASTVKPPPRHGIGPSAFYDGRYLISPQGDVALECLSCSENIPLKSNMAILEEYVRLRARADGPAQAKARKQAGCPNTACANHGHAPEEHASGEYKPQRRYIKFGQSAKGKPRLRCRSCGRTWVQGESAMGRPRRELNPKEQQVFQGLVSHMPYKRMARLFGMYEGRLHQLLERHEADAMDAQAVLEEALPEALSGRRLTLSTDRQFYPVNWSERTDRRTVTLYSAVTADQGTGYVLCADVNYDPDVDPAQLEADALEGGDYGKHPAYRTEARLWLPGEYAKEAGNPAAPVVGATAPASSARRYAMAAAREDVEQPETIGRAPSMGAIVREDIALYAHFQVLRQRVALARHVTHCFEQESAMRAACLTAFADRVREGRCEAFYVRIDKGFTAERKQRVASASRQRVKAVQVQYGCDGLEARRILVRQALTEQPQEERGPWRDRWLVHPAPTAFEPAKEVCRLTRQANEGPEEENQQAVHGFAFASLHAVDRFFLNVRYKVNALDRHRNTASAGRAWNVYHPYNPARVPALLAIYRLWHNWCAENPGDITPAMRMGLAVRPLETETLVERGPRAALEEARRPLLSPEPAPVARPQKREVRRQPEEECVGPEMGFGS